MLHDYAPKLEKVNNSGKKSSSINSDGSIDIKEILGIEKLSKLLEQFYCVTGLANAVVDLEGNILCRVGWKSICPEFHRKNKIALRRCMKSGTILAGRLKKNDIYAIYTCQNGMMDASIPVIIDQIHIANVIVGQFFFETSDKDSFVRQTEKPGSNVSVKGTDAFQIQ